jgi:N-acylglucosamine 2-epimerase
MAVGSQNGSILNTKEYTTGLNSPAFYAGIYREELLSGVLPFWEKYSRDEINGGFYTCLRRDGSVFDTDKFMWLQGRQVWCFSHMYNHVEQNPDWRTMALHGAAFLQKHGRDEAGNWYFSTTAEGKPLVQPYNIFSDCFAAMAFSALDKAAPNEEYKNIAISTFENILSRQHNWKGKYNKAYPDTRPLKSFSLPMILCNLSLEMEHLLGRQRVNDFIPEVIEQVMNVFYQPQFDVTLENISMDGSFSNSFEGRLLNPGHTIEAMWFIMDLGKRMNDAALIRKACDRMLHTLEYGWDKEFGGIFYFMDVMGKPLQQLEWDQKLWWVHAEALVALAKGYALTGDARCLNWFHTVHNYTWKNFRDPVFGEWFGYLNRQGEVLLDLKGGKWKGCFHVPRALFQVWKTMEAIEKNNF